MSANKQTPNRPPRPPRSTFQRLARRFMSGLLRSLFFINKPVRHRKAGFVLPTTVLLLLVMTLTVGALTFRSASRTQSAFLAREQQVIDNVAAPAIDRAKSKLEYLFSRDSRMPGTDTPSSDIISTLMLNITSVGADGLGITRVPNIDPYTLPDEVRIDLNGDDTLDNAWSFAFDIDGDGNTSGDEIIAYSILMDDAVDPLAIDGDDSTDPTPERDDDIKLEDTGVIIGGGPNGEDLDLVERKARNLITRNGPINTNNSLASCGASRAPAQGWLAIGAPGAAALEKNFQITAFVSNGKDLGRANSALELQQVRLAQRGNTWGAWFKYDLEVHPGPNFNWNGAIHTDGNMLVTNNLRAHMISSHNSCLYSNEASAITMAEVNNDGVEGVIVTEDDSEDFQGQLIAGVPGYGDMNGRGNPGFHLSTGPGSAPTTDNNLNSDNDSVTGNTFSHLTDIAMDPIALFTLNESRHRRTGTWTRDEDWSSEAFNTSGRVTNQEQDPPFLDDFFRADNRYGPKPNYEKYKWVEDTDEGVGGAVTTTRNDPDYDKRIGDEIISTDPRADNLTNATDGLDGYWERKSITNGMRVVVGQRLELGNSLGWNSSLNGATTDPIYPPEISNLRNKQLQRVMLRDNLAAVQGMVVYHYGVNNGLAPLACVANTVHPGTLQTLRASRTFDASASGVLQTNFFEGEGTNGWEFSYPAALDSVDAGGDVDEAEFGSALANNQPMGIALRNLAHFAGDPNGGSPSFMPVQDANVHPFPHQSMWGDFSVLRRIFDDYLDSGTWRSSTNPPQLTNMGDRYVALSPADKASLQSAACTMGLLAYNVDTVLSDYTSALTAGGSLQSVGVELSKLVDHVSSPGNPQIEDLIPTAEPKGIWYDEDPNTILQDEDGNDLLDGSGNAICPAGSDGPGFDDNCDTAEYYRQFATEDWIEAYRLSANPTPSAADIVEIENAVEAVKSGNQLIRDRALGFRPGNPVGLDALTGGSDNVSWSPSTGLTDQQQIGGNDVVVQLTCDPDIFNQLTNSGGGGGSSNRSRIGLALMICSDQTTTPVKYPSLYYLFPMVDHDHDGAVAAGETAVSPAFAANHSQPGTEEYIDRVSTYAVNNGYIYQVLGDANGDNLDNNGENGYAAIAFIPRANDGSDWVLPTEFLGPGTLDPGSMDIQVPNGGLVALSLLDKAMYNGREEMLVRILDLDLQKLTRNTVNGGDYWISDNRDTANGLVYGVREDAMREDAITRPAAAAWTSCNTLTTILDDDTCWMQPNRIAADGGLNDPPLSRREDGSVVGISTKPVDFAPDPDRRPHGFRLKAALDGNDGDLSDRTNRLRGLTFVTDNAAYIQGEFNPHTSDGANTIEEFTQTLFNNNVGFGGAFYSGRTTVDNTFASAETDRWRVAEVLADAVYLLSNNYVDGSVEDGFILDLTQTSADFGGSRTSFQNQQRPVRDNNEAWGKRDHWYRIDGSRGANGGDTTLPIWVGRNGESMARGGSNLSNTDDTVFADAENGNFELPDQRDRAALIDAPNERMNATIISGIVPSRSGQGYGGLHNFPRFLEDWGGRSLFIQGAFLQLNFSTAGTGPFDADAWDPGDTPIVPDERIRYYDPPARRWGYDVALQFVPAGPISQRFVSVGKPRSEHYRELPIEDPYVTTLRCSRFLPDPNDPGSFENRFPDVSDEDCPNRP